MPDFKQLADYLYINRNAKLGMYDLLENFCARWDLTLDQTSELPDDASDFDIMLYALLHLAADGNL